MSEVPPSGKPSYGSAVRMAQIMHWLHGSPIGISFQELVERLDISERTLTRYITTLRESFFDDNGESLVEVLRTERGGRLRFRRKGMVVEGNAYELMSLYLALDLMAFLEGTFLMDEAQEALERMQERMRRHHQTALIFKDFRKKFFHWTEAPKDYKAHNQILDHLVKSLVLQKQIELVYQSPGKSPKQHLVFPLSLLMYKRALYLIARRPAKGSRETRDLTFAVERIHEIRVSEDGFFYPQDYDPHKRFQNSFGLIQESEIERVVLNFDPIVAANVASRRWHRSQECQLETNGSLQVTFELYPGQEFLAWLMSYGPYVKVKEPPSLKETVRTNLIQALSQYQTDLD